MTAALERKCEASWSAVTRVGAPRASQLSASRSTVLTVLRCKRVQRAAEPKNKAEDACVCAGCGCRDHRGPPTGPLSARCKRSLALPPPTDPSPSTPLPTGAPLPPPPCSVASPGPPSPSPSSNAGMTDSWACRMAAVTSSLSSVCASLGSCTTPGKCRGSGRGHLKAARRSSFRANAKGRYSRQAFSVG